MSTATANAVCAECLQAGRCRSDCHTQGFGRYIATGFTENDSRMIVNSTTLPSGQRGVLLLVVGHGTRSVNVLTEECGQMLVQNLTDALAPRSSTT